MKTFVIILSIVLAGQTSIVSKECKFATLRDKFTKEEFHGTTPHFIFRKSVRGAELAFASDGSSFLLYLIFYRDFSKPIYLGIRPESRGKRKWRNLPVANKFAENRDRRITPWNRARISRLTK